SRGDSTPTRAINKDCSRQSSRDKREVDGTRKPADCQSASGTSVAVRGGAEVTAATTASAKSVQSNRTGRFFDPLPSVKGMSATHSSPGRNVVIQTFVFGSVAAQKRRMAALRSCR